MKQLAQLQQAFQDYVLHPGKPGMASRVCADTRADPATRLAVYALAYRARLREVLANDYPAVVMGIGDEQFSQLAEDYMDAYPSSYYSLRDFGRDLPGFVFKLIQQHQRYLDKHWLHELALFERTLGQAFDAPDSTPLGERDMALIPAESWSELRFEMHPSVHRMDFEWDLPRIWQALTHDSPSQVTASRGTSSPWLVWRERLVTRFRSLETDEQLALDRLLAGGNFAEVCEALSTAMSQKEVPLRAAGLLKSWIAQGLIGGIRE